MEKINVVKIDNDGRKIEEEQPVDGQVIVEIPVEEAVAIVPMKEDIPEEHVLRENVIEEEVTHNETEIEQEGEGEEKAFTEDEITSGRLNKKEQERGCFIEIILDGKSLEEAFKEIESSSSEEENEKGFSNRVPANPYRPVWFSDYEIVRVIQMAEQMEQTRWQW